MNQQNEVLSRIRAFQKEMEGVPIIKATEAYGYYYATLEDILKIITPLLRKHKIWYQHSSGFDSPSSKNYLTTFVYCEDNVSDFVASKTLIDGEAKLGGMNKFMVEGSAITYFRRYHITTLLGLTTDEDTDASGKTVVKKKGKTGRSVEAVATTSSGPDFVKVFQGFLDKKTHEQINKMFDVYKSQMNKEEIEAVSKIITEKFNK